MITCIAVDDEPLALNLLKNYIEQTASLQLQEATTDVYHALQRVQNENIDLVFLDIQMPELTGIQFMKIIKGKSKVVLTTAYEEYALQAFDHDVVDYLLKPFSLQRFQIAVEKVKERLHIQGSKQEKQTDHILVKSSYKTLRIALTDIFYMESLRDYVAIHTLSEGKILTLQSLKSFEEQLQSHGFIRIHKSYLISLSKVKFAEKRKLLINDAELPISDTYYEAFWKAFTP